MISTEKNKNQTHTHTRRNGPKMKMEKKDSRCFDDEDDDGKCKHIKILLLRNSNRNRDKNLTDNSSYPTDYYGCTMCYIQNRNRSKIIKKNIRNNEPHENKSNSTNYSNQKRLFHWRYADEMEKNGGTVFLKPVLKRIKLQQQQQIKDL